MRAVGFASMKCGFASPFSRFRQPPSSAAIRRDIFSRSRRRHRQYYHSRFYFQIFLILSPPLFRPISGAHNFGGVDFWCRVSLRAQKLAWSHFMPQHWQRLRVISLFTFAAFAFLACHRIFATRVIIYLPFAYRAYPMPADDWPNSQEDFLAQDTPARGDKTMILVTTIK